MAAAAPEMKRPLSLRSDKDIEAELKRVMDISYLLAISPSEELSGGRVVAIATTAGETYHLSDPMIRTDSKGKITYLSMKHMISSIAATGAKFVDIAWKMPTADQLEAAQSEAAVNKESIHHMDYAIDMTKERGAESVTFTFDANVDPCTIKLKRARQSGDLDLIRQHVIETVIVRYRAESIFLIDRDVNPSLRGDGKECIEQMLRSLFDERFETPAPFEPKLTNGRIEFMSTADRWVSLYKIDKDVITTDPYNVREDGDTIIITIADLAELISIYGLHSVSVTWTIPEGVVLDEDLFPTDMEGVEGATCLTMDTLMMDYDPSYIMRGG